MFKGPSFVFEIEGSRDREILLYYRIFKLPFSANAGMVYLKELGRSVPTGLLIGSDSRAKISIDKDLSTAQINYKHLMDENVDRMEVKRSLFLFFCVLVVGV